jgi:hypothetical protein
VTRLASRFVIAYLIAVVALAAIGSHGQTRYRHHARLLERKDVALIALAQRRAEAAAVNGPLAISSWARAAGMVPAPEVRDVIRVAPSPVPPPHARLLPPTLEVRTVWR